MKSHLVEFFIVFLGLGAHSVLAADFGLIVWGYTTEVVGVARHRTYVSLLLLGLWYQ